MKILTLMLQHVDFARMRQYFGLAAKQMAFNPDTQEQQPERKELAPDDAFTISISDEARSLAQSQTAPEAATPIIKPKMKRLLADGTVQQAADNKALSGTWKDGKMTLSNGTTGEFRSSNGGGQVYFTLGKMQGLLFGSYRGVAVSQDSQAVKFKAAFKDGKFNFSEISRIPVEYTTKQLVWEGKRTETGATSSSMDIQFDNANHLKATLTTRDNEGKLIEIPGEGIKDGSGNIIIGMGNGVVYPALYEDDGETVRFFNHEVM